MEDEKLDDIIKSLVNLYPLLKWKESNGEDSNIVANSINKSLSRVHDVLLSSSKDRSLLEAMSIHFDVPVEALIEIEVELFGTNLNDAPTPLVVTMINEFFMSLQSLREEGKLHSYTLDVLLREGGSHS